MYEDLNLFLIKRGNEGFFCLTFTFSTFHSSDIIAVSLKSFDRNYNKTQKKEMAK